MQILLQSLKPTLFWLQIYFKQDNFLAWKIKRQNRVGFENLNGMQSMYILHAILHYHFLALKHDLEILWDFIFGDAGGGQKVAI